MKVSKSSMETYRVRHNGEWATIALQAWQQSDGSSTPRIMDAGEILVHSSFGSWGHQWGNMGLPLKPFLIGMSMDYLMGKFMSGNLREFDYMASQASWHRHLVAARRSRQLTSEQFREVWDATCVLHGPCSIDLFVHRLEESRPLELRDHPLWDAPQAYIVCRTNAQAAGFWREIWPKFIESLRSEFVPANESAMVA